jgi:hypothetical protein
VTRLLALLLLAASARAQAPIILSVLYDAAYSSSETPFAQIVWAPDGVSTYQVYRSTVSGGPYTLLATGPFAFANNCGPGCYVDLAVQWGIQYFYVLSTVAGPYSNEISAPLPGNVVTTTIVLECGAVVTEAAPVN